MEKELKTIKRVILEVARKYGIEVDRIILFGSRARGDYREDSDWDILIVTKEKLDTRTLNVFWGELEKELVYAGIIPEIIVVDKETFEKHRRPAYVFYYAEKEGVLIR